MWPRTWRIARYESEVPEPGNWCGRVIQCDAALIPGLSYVAATVLAVVGPLNLLHDASVGELIGRAVSQKTVEYWNVMDFTKYLGIIGLSGDVGSVTLFLGAMERQ
jgi:hypothetical protein